jgi:hypothetical protein
MSLQHQRVVELCNELRLGGVAAQYSALAQKAAEKHTSFTDFVEELLSAERESRRARAREMFARIGGFPAIKTLDQYDFNFATGTPRKQIMGLASLAFVERAENVVFLGPPIQRHNAHLAMWPYLLGLVALVEHFVGVFAAALRPQQRLLPFRSPVVRG